jgi:hypothetical protein
MTDEELILAQGKSLVSIIRSQSARIAELESRETELEEALREIRALLDCDLTPKKMYEQSYPIIKAALGKHGAR